MDGAATLGQGRGAGVERYQGLNEIITNGLAGPWTVERRDCERHSHRYDAGRHAAIARSAGLAEPLASLHCG